MYCVYGVLRADVWVHDQYLTQLVEARAIVGADSKVATGPEHVMGKEADARQHDDAALIAYQDLCPVHLKDNDYYAGAMQYRRGSAQPWKIVRRKHRYKELLKLEPLYFTVCCVHFSSRLSSHSDI